MRVERDDGLYEVQSSDHPTYWVRVWVKPEVENPGPYGLAWNSDAYRISGAADVHEVFRWAAEQRGHSEIFVEAADANPPFLLHIAGYNPARADGAKVSDYVSDPRTAAELTALLD